MTKHLQSFTLTDFRFHTGEVMDALTMAVTTVGNPEGEPVLLLHGTGGSSASFLDERFASVLFGSGQALDASRYFLIIPDSLGHGASAKPSDGLGPRFPRYNYEDMVRAQHRLVTEALGIQHLRLVMGNSMGGMHAWLWGALFPGWMDALVPMACRPTPMSGRNWILRRMLVEAIRSDPDYLQGDYTMQPRSARLASVFFSFATNGGTLALEAAAPDRESADALLDAQLAAPFRPDANDLIHQWEASADFDASQWLDRITARVLTINSQDDERNPPELRQLEQTTQRLRHGRHLLIPASAQTTGHSTTWNPVWYRTHLADLLREGPRLPVSDPA